MRCRVLPVIALALACGNDETTPGGQGGTGAGQGGAGGAMVTPPGDTPCDMTNTIPQADGTCMPVAAAAGVASCATGFSEEDGGCVPLLPESCPPGEMAVPGEASCRAVLDCGAAPWGALPPTGTFVYVDAAANAGGDGSEIAPYDTLLDATQNAPDGATIVVAEGNYQGPVILDRGLSLWGRCPDLVTIDSPNTVIAAVIVDASNVTVHGVSITGAQAGMYLLPDYTGNTIQNVHVFDTANDGIQVQSPTTLHNVLIENTALLGLTNQGTDVTATGIVVRGSQRIGVAVGPPGTLAIEGSVIEDNARVGLLVTGSPATVEGSVIRRSTADVDDLGIGLRVQPSVAAGTRGDATVTRSVITDSHGSGLACAGSVCAVVDSVVSDTAPDDEGFGRGVDVLEHLGHAAEATITTSLVQSNHEHGITCIDDASVTVDRVIVRDTQPSPVASGNERFGVGIGAFVSSFTTPSPRLSVVSSLIAGNSEVGISGKGATVDVVDTFIVGTLPNTENDLFGRGISVQSSAGGLPAALTVRDTLIDGNTEAGCVLIGSGTATLERVVVRDTLPHAGGNQGFGLVFQGDADDIIATVRDSYVLRSNQVGVLLQGGALELSSSTIRDTRAGADGSFGDGLVLIVPVAGENHATVTNCVITGNARAGIASFAGEVTLTGSQVACNAVDLNTETMTADASIADGGDNACACDDTQEACRVLSSTIEPPPPI